MARALNYVVLLSIVAMIVAASGCSSNTPNNTSAPATTTPEPSATPIETTAIPVETTAIPVETATPVVTPASLEETPVATENTTSISVASGTSTNTGALKIIPANGSTTNATGNQTINISTAQRKFQIKQAQSGNSGAAASQNVTVNVTVTASNSGY